MRKAVVCGVSPEKGAFPNPKAVAGGVALSVTLAFAFTPQMFALTLPRGKRVDEAGKDSETGIIALR
jgi:hypothetical protein